ncbi:MAG: hypothetical protein HQ565_03115 [Bacteroidetes bacterium]|nr:hypothetical protein [Bacteroidota bacterium]
MKTNGFLIILIVLLGLGLTSCSTTTETTTNTNHTKQVQKLQIAQQNIQEGSERSGLSADEMHKLNDYAKNKAHMACKIANIDKSASQALSNVAEDELKESIIALDDKLTALSHEIEAYCNNEDRKKFFRHAYNQYYLACKQ